MIQKNWTELIKPKRLEVEGDSHSTSYGKFSCEPLERGFGTTMGNALRRVLLSSLRGAAIVGVNICKIKIIIFQAQPAGHSTRSFRWRKTLT